MEMSAFFKLQSLLQILIIVTTLAEALEPGLQNHDRDNTTTIKPYCKDCIDKQGSTTSHLGRNDSQENRSESPEKEITRAHVPDPTFCVQFNFYDGLDPKIIMAILECQHRSFDGIVGGAFNREKFEGCLEKKDLSLKTLVDKKIVTRAPPEKCGKAERDVSGKVNKFKSRLQVICLIRQVQDDFKIRVCVPEGVKLFKNNTQEQLAEYYRNNCKISKKDSQLHLSKRYGESISFKTAITPVQCLDTNSEIDNIIERAEKKDPIFYIAIYVITAFAAVGNLMIVIMIKRAKLNGLDNYLTSLYIMEVIYAASSLALLHYFNPLHKESTFSLVEEGAQMVNGFMHPACEFINTSLLTSNIGFNLITLVAVWERYRAVVGAIAHRIMNASQSWKACLMIAGAATLLAITFILITRIAIPSTGENPQNMCSLLPPLIINNLAYKIFIILWLCLFNAVPYLAGIYMCIQILKTIKKSAIRRQEIETGSSDESGDNNVDCLSPAAVKMAILMVSHTVSYIISSIPLVLQIVAMSFDLVSFAKNYKIWETTIIISPLLKMVFSLPINLHYSVSMKRVMMSESGSSSKKSNSA